MRHPGDTHASSFNRQLPTLQAQASQLAGYLRSLSPEDIQRVMKISKPMSIKTHALLQQWSGDAATLPAIDLFLGDIYSGLQAHTFTEKDRAYANDHLFILSGLYGVLRALDEIQPYRLEMGYKLPDHPSLYAFWGNKIAEQLPKHQTIINLSAVEYTKAVFPHIKGEKIISPKFLTVSPKTGEPVFVTVHAKVARGAFARWIIKERIESINDIQRFSDLGYAFSKSLSSDAVPVFVAQEFKGIGLSIRLRK